MVEAAAAASIDETMIAKRTHGEAFDNENPETA